jgi:multisubunit Na+/H+ antiporter MnhF subunit
MKIILWLLGAAVALRFAWNFLSIARLIRRSPKTRSGVLTLCAIVALVVGLMILYGPTLYHAMYAAILRLAS